MSLPPRHPPAHRALPAPAALVLSALLGGAAAVALAPAATRAVESGSALLRRVEPDPQERRDLGPALGVLNLSGRFELARRRDTGRLNVEVWRAGKLVHRYGATGGTSVVHRDPGGATSGVDSGAFVVQLVDPRRLKLADVGPGRFRIASSLLLGDGRTVYHHDVAFREFPFQAEGTSVGWFGEVGSGPDDAPLLYLTSHRSVYNGSSLQHVLEHDPGPILVLRLSFEK
jgi:hypothetical protein